MSGHHRPADWKPNSQIAREHLAHMDFLPVPSGSWTEANAKLQGRFNMQLLASIGACVVVYGYIIATDGMTTVHFPKYKDVEINLD